MADEGGANFPTYNFLGKSASYEYCADWPRRDEREDIRYEAYARVYEAAIKSRPTSPKAFLFTTTRNLMADRIRRERIVSVSAGGDSDYLDVLVDEISPEQRVGASQEMARLARAFDRLTPKCRCTDGGGG